MKGVGMQTSIIPALATNEPQKKKATLSDSYTVGNVRKSNWHFKMRCLHKYIEDAKNVVHACCGTVYFTKNNASGHCKNTAQCTQIHSQLRKSSISDRKETHWQRKCAGYDPGVPTKRDIILVSLASVCTLHSRSRSRRIAKLDHKSLSTTTESQLIF